MAGAFFLLELVLLGATGLLVVLALAAAPLLGRWVLGVAALLLIALVTAPRLGGVAGRAALAFGVLGGAAGGASALAALRELATDPIYGERAGFGWAALALALVAAAGGTLAPPRPKLAGALLVGGSTLSGSWRSTCSISTPSTSSRRPPAGSARPWRWRGPRRRAPDPADAGGPSVCVPGGPRARHGERSSEEGDTMRAEPVHEPRGGAPMGAVADRADRARLWLAWVLAHAAGFAAGGVGAAVAESAAAVRAPRPSAS